MPPGKQFAEFLDREGLRDRESLAAAGLLRGDAGQQRLLMGVVGVEQVLRLFDKLFDPDEFLSPYGLRSISAYHRDHPYTLEVEGLRATVDYEPAESTTDMFGGNSNWRGPVWFPLNYLARQPLSSATTASSATTSRSSTRPDRAARLALDAVADDLCARLVSIFLVGPDGRRPCFGGVDRLQHDPNWQDNLMFNEYFHGDNAAGLGATHQTGWTGIVADIIRRRHGRRAVHRGRPPRDARTVDEPRRPTTAPRSARCGGPAGRDSPTPTARTSPSPRQPTACCCACSTPTAPRPRSRCRSVTATSGTGSCPASRPVRPTATGPPGPYDPRRGLRCNPAKLLLDPYARAIDGEVRFGPEVLGYAVGDPDAPSTLDSAGHVPRSLVVDPSFDWSDLPRPSHSYADTIIYEVHVKGFTAAHPTYRRSCAARTPGWPTRPRVAHLVELGVTAVELLPVHQSVPERSWSSAA